MKTQFSIRLCRDEVSKAEPKYEKPGAEWDENGAFDSAVPRPQYPSRDPVSIACTQTLRSRKCGPYAAQNRNLDFMEIRISSEQRISGL